MFVASYPPDSAGMVRAANELDLQTKLFGGGMVGLQYASLQTSLGPLLNGIVNYDFWVPEPTLDFPGIQEFLTKYQERAEGQGVDPLGHYLPPFAYAYLQVLGDAVEAVGSLDQEAIAEHIRDNDLRDGGRPGQVRPERRVGDLAGADGAVPEHRGRRARAVQAAGKRIVSCSRGVGFRRVHLPVHRSQEVAHTESTDLQTS